MGYRAGDKAGSGSGRVRKQGCGLRAVLGCAEAGLWRLVQVRRYRRRWWCTHPMRQARCCPAVCLCA